MKKLQVILASKSPRRSQLLTDAGIDFEIKVKDVEEIYPDDLPVNEVAPYLAQLKAQASREFLEPGKVMLTADSVVILGDQIYGKPKDYEEAFQILRALSGKAHLVITGVCLLSQEKEKVFSSVSKVYLEELTDDEIDSYIRKFKPYDKAGAYAIQEWIGLCKISKIEGLYSNIMGLPVAAVYKELMDF